jgi:hypothetical protein
MTIEQSQSDALDFLFVQDSMLRTFHVEFRIVGGVSWHPENDFPIAEIDSVLDGYLGTPSWRDAGYQMSIIGTDWSGGLFCTWKYPELDGRSPPVVYVGSYGDGRAVVANDLIAFVELLATGKIWRDSEFVDDEQPEEHLQFAKDAKSRFSLASRSAEEIQAEGFHAHPNFAKWMDSLSV